MGYTLQRAPLSFPPDGIPDTILNITFYNSSGKIITMRWERFKKIVDKINKE